jgi:hypothetical protein
VWDVDADRRRELARGEELVDRLPGLDRHDVRRRLVLRDVLVAREHPRDLVEVDAVLRRKHPARPDARGDRVAAVDADAFPLEVPWLAHDPRVRQDRAVVEAADEEDRQRRECLPVLAGTRVGGDRQLADVVGALTHHPPERADQRVDLLELELDAAGRDGAVLERRVRALRARDRGQPRCHGRVR